jgi:hypothetical protein
MSFAAFARFTRLNAVRDQRDNYFSDALVEWWFKIQLPRAPQFLRVSHKRRSARAVPAKFVVGVTLHQKPPSQWPVLLL